MQNAFYLFLEKRLSHVFEAMHNYSIIYIVSRRCEKIGPLCFLLAYGIGNTV